MIPQMEPWLGEEEIAEVTEVIRSNWITEGKKTAQFEKKIAELCGVKHALAVNNGTMALLLALMILDIGEGDEVIVPDFTFIASANAVKFAGGTPVFVDIDEKTFNINPDEIEGAITPRTKAIMPVHLFGQPAEMDRICQIAEKHRLLIVEDACQALGVKYNKKQTVGSFGQANAMSFFADKSITTGEGGAVLTDDDELARKCIILKNQGRGGRGYYYHEYLGYNFRLTDLQSAIGLAQLSKFDKIIERKNNNRRLYEEKLAGVDGVELTYNDPRHFIITFRVTVQVEDPQKLVDFLASQDIDARRFNYPLHAQPCYNVEGEFPNSVKAYETGVYLPSSARLTEEDISYVCDKIKLFLETNST